MLKWAHVGSQTARHHHFNRLLHLQTSEKKMLQKEHQNKAPGEQQPAEEDAEDEVIYRIDIPANRYDMMCLEGISRALNIFTGRARAADYNYRLADMTGEQEKCLTDRVAACRQNICYEVRKEGARGDTGGAGLICWPVMVWCGK